MMRHRGEGKWLDAFDSFTAYLNRSCARTPGRGNHFLILLELDGTPDPGAVSDFFRSLPDLPPILFGRVRRFLHSGRLSMRPTRRSARKCSAWPRFPAGSCRLPVMRLLENHYGPKLGGTFLFSLLEESGLTGKKVFGRPVRNLRHLPLMPPRPGLGIIFNRAGTNMNLTVSLRAGLFPEETAKRLFRNLQAELNGNESLSQNP